MDAFATTQNFNFEGGSSSYRSATGAFLNICILMLTLTFTIQQVLILTAYDGTSFTSSLEVDYQSDDFVVGPDQGLKFAYALMDFETLTGFDREGTPVSDYVHMEAGVIIQRISEEGSMYFEDKPIEFHTCTEDDLAQFYPTRESQAQFAEQAKPFFKCVTMDEFYVQGTRSSTFIHRPYINLKLPASECRNGTYDAQCVTSAAFDQRIENAILVTWTNQERFDQSYYGKEDPVAKVSDFDWFSIPRSIEVHNFFVQEDEIISEDNLFMTLDNFTTKQVPFFQIRRGLPDTRIYNNPENNIRLQLTYYINRDSIHYSRQVYNTFMLLGDVGGFSGLLFSIAGTFVAFVNFNNSENFLATSLYKAKDGGELNCKNQFALKEYLQDALPACCLKLPCFTISRQDQAFRDARERLVIEMDLVSLLQQLRFFNAAINLLLVPAKVKALKSNLRRVPTLPDNAQLYEMNEMSDLSDQPDAERPAESRSIKYSASDQQRYKPQAPRRMSQFYSEKKNAIDQKVNIHGVQSRQRIIQLGSMRDPDETRNHHFTRSNIDSSLDLSMNQ